MFAFMKHTILFLLLVLSLHASAQNEIVATGRILDAHSRKGIKALIQYSSMPTGGISGKFNDSTFTFGIFGTARYQIKVEATGYHSTVVTVDPKDINSSNQLVRDIYLTPLGETITLSSLIFEQGKSVINSKSFEELDRIADMLKENEKMTIQLEGHTDNMGSAKANMALSQNRVDAVKKYLVGKGVQKNQVKTKAFGGTRPIANGNSSESRAANRRVEMRILTE